MVARQDKVNMKPIDIASNKLINENNSFSTSTHYCNLHEIKTGIDITVFMLPKA